MDEYINKRYSFLRKCANNITKKRRACANDDLLSELILYVYTNPTKIEKYISDELVFEKFCIKWMNSQFNWSNSPFNNKYRESIEYIDITNSSYEDESDEIYKDLSSIYTDKQIDKIMFVYNFYDTLNPAEQLLFRLYFIERKSLEKIKNEVSFTKNKMRYNNRTIVFLQIKKIKQKIKLAYDNARN